MTKLWDKPVFLKLGSTKGCQQYLETKRRNGRRTLLAVLNLYVRIRIRVATFDTNRSVIDSTQSVAASFQQLLDKQTLLFHSISDLLWTGRGSVAFSRFRELQYFEKHGARLSRNRIPARKRSVPRFQSVLTVCGARDVTTPKRTGGPAANPGDEQAGALRCQLTSNQR